MAWDGPWTGWTTRRNLKAGAAAALTVLALLGVVGAWSLVRVTQLTNHLENHSAPALAAAVKLESALIDQETGIRGYGLTGQSDFLQPYSQGLTDEGHAVSQLRAATAGDAEAQRDLSGVLAAAQRWQGRIAAPIAAAPPGAPVALAAQRAEEGKADFDAFRAASQTQQTHLRADRAAAARRMQDYITLRNWIFVVITALITAFIVLCFIALRRGIIQPLERLAADAGRVAGGQFEHPIAATGPTDLRALASGVEEMRQRLVAELAAIDAARRKLDEQAGELRRSNAELEQFAYVASHDLQEPLRKVASFCQLLQRHYAGQLDERAQQYIAIAVDGATRMQELINDLLAFSRVGRAPLDRTEVDLEEVLDSVLDALSLAVDESGAQITHDRLPRVLGDRSLLTLLIQNLLSNALKFRDPQRRPEIRVTAQAAPGLWRFAVTDNGIGIEPEYTERVFAIFQRLHTRDAYPGSGIGLALCRKIVEFHGGGIALDPEYQSGARFVFTLPDHGAATTTTDAGPAGVSAP